MKSYQLHPLTIRGDQGSYHGLLRKYLNKSIDFIIEGGSRDCADAIKLNWELDKKVYAFECNPTAANICRKNLALNSISTRALYSAPWEISPFSVRAQESQ